MPDTNIAVFHFTRGGGCSPRITCEETKNGLHRLGFYLDSLRKFPQIYSFALVSQSLLTDEDDKWTIELLKQAQKEGWIWGEVKSGGYYGGASLISPTTGTHAIWRDLDEIIEIYNKEVSSNYLEGESLATRSKSVPGYYNHAKICFDWVEISAGEISTHKFNDPSVSAVCDIETLKKARKADGQNLRFVWQTYPPKGWEDIARVFTEYPQIKYFKRLSQGEL